jgi:hypothetical protein
VPGVAMQAAHTTSARSRLPEDLVEKAVQRLGVFAAVSALAQPALFFGLRAVVPEDQIHQNHHIFTTSIFFASSQRRPVDFFR